MHNDEIFPVVADLRVRPHACHFELNEKSECTIMDESLGGTNVHPYVCHSCYNLQDNIPHPYQETFR